MQFEDIRVGDVLRIRQWDDMVAEFGTNEGRNINCKFIFTGAMRLLCGKTFTVRRKGSSRLFSVEGVERLRGEGMEWTISADMLEPACEEEDLFVGNSAESLFAFLTGAAEG